MLGDGSVGYSKEESSMERAITVCIPCYRDLAGLTDTISSLIGVLAEAPSIRCEFAIGLNHCDFGECEVLEPFCDVENCLFSIARSEVYLEYDHSLLLTISQASEDVCLLMGCGDIARPGLGIAIEKFMDDSLKMGVLLVEHGTMNSPLDTPNYNWLPTSSGFFNKVLSGHLFDRKVLSEAAGDQLIGFEWGHVELAIRGAAIAGGKTSVISQPVIWRSVNSNGWWTRTDIIKQYIEYCFLIDGYHKKYPDLSFPAVEARKSGGVRLLLTILQARYNGFREMPLFLLLWQEKHKVGKPLKMLIRMSFLIPRPLVRRCYKLLVLAVRLRR